MATAPLLANGTNPVEGRAGAALSLGRKLILF